MQKLNLDDVTEYVNDNIQYFHKNRIEALSKLDLKGILKKKNPYLFKAKDINIASDLIKNFLDATLSSSEEKIFGDFLENLAIFISSKTCSGRKSAATGIDLEFQQDNIHYLVSVKSGPNWGNRDQQDQQERNFKNALRVLKQSKHTLNVQPVLGICYGKTRNSFLRGYMKLVGQNFWYFLSNDENLYTDIVKPLGHRAKENNELFNNEKERLINLFTKQFMNEFCDDKGNIKWEAVVKFNSGNLKK